MRLDVPVHAAHLGRRAVSLLLFLLVALVALPAVASAAPDITLDKDAPAEVLIGDTSPVTLTASNPLGQPVGYNLSFRDVLPAGVSYVPGSAGGTAGSPGEPQIITNAPVVGQTTLIWTNVADLTPASNYALSYRVSPNGATPGETYTNSAGAYVNDFPRNVPDFDPVTGEPGTDITGSATDAATTKLLAIEITKDEPSPEGEILRGLHDHQTVYTLTLKNNYLHNTSNLAVDDYVPAGLEFLGCPGAAPWNDNTTVDNPVNPGSTDEYAGSGPINPGNQPPTTDCLPPSSVETVELDPDDTGPLPFGVYTHVRWDNLGSLPPSTTSGSAGTRKIQYVVAVPERANAMQWGALGAASAPDPASGKQAANLDNNAGDPTTDEQDLHNGAMVGGRYNGATDVTDWDDIHRTAEDMAIQKSVDQDTIAIGEVSWWTLDVEIGEYSAVNNIVATDTVPNGLCPLNGVTPLQASTSCDAPDGATDVPSSPYAGGAAAPVENADGTWTLTWKAPTTPEFATMPSSHTDRPNSTFQIRFPTRTRTTYRENGVDAGPVLANDAWSNHVDLAGTRVVGDLPIVDESDADQQAAGPTLDKTVAPYDYHLGSAPCSALDPGDGHGVDGDYGDVPPVIGAGDRVCWKLRMNFPAALDTGGVVVSDFLPTNIGEVFPGSMATTANNTVNIDDFDPTTVPGVPTWTLGTSSIVGEEQVFEVVFATQIDDPGAARPGDLIGNLMKASSVNTDSDSFPLRSEADYAWTQPVSLLKGVEQVDRGGNPVFTPPNGPNVTNVPIQGGDIVTYRVDLSNGAPQAAVDSVVWDNLPTGIDCTMVTDITSSGTCTGTRVTWTGIGVPAHGTTKLNYDVHYPTTVTTIGNEFVNTAGIRQYDLENNTGPDDTFTYFPRENIDPTVPLVDQNAPPAKDTARVFVAQPTLTKDRTTEIDEAGNNAASQATIGERVDYTVKFTVKAGTTMTNAVVTDPLNARQTLLTGTAAIAFDDGSSTTVPLGTVVSTNTNTVTLTLPPTYTANPTNVPAGTHDAVFTLTYGAIVRNVAANSSTGTALTNTATLTADGLTPIADSTSTTIVEPRVSIAKTHAPAAATVSPGEDIAYTLTTSNAANTGGANVSAAHDVTVTDIVPEGMTYVAGSATTAPTSVQPDTPTTGRTTITWDLPGTIDPGASAPVTPITYHATVDDPAVAGAPLTNAAAVTAASLDDASGAPHPDRRDAGNAPPGVGGVYADDDSLTLRLALPTIDKTVSPTSGPVGTVLNYTVKVTIPASTRIYNGTVLDVLGDGLVFDAYGDTSCAGCSPDVTITPMNPASTDAGTGETKIAWYLGDDSDVSATARVVELHYTAHVAQTYTVGGGSVLPGATLPNEASILSNETPDLTPPTTPAGVNPGDYDQHAEDPASVTVTRPHLAIAKTVDDHGTAVHDRAVQPGDGPFDFTLTVTNTGDADAYDASVTDVLPKGTTYVAGSASVTPAQVQADTPTAGQTTITWALPGPVVNGTPQTITYRADLAASGTLDTTPLTNTADIPSYWEEPASERNDPAHSGFDYNEYDDVTPDSDTLTPSFPDLTTSKSAPDGPDAEIGEPFRWQVRVSNASPSADAQDVDVTDVLPPDWAYVAGSAEIDTGSGFVPLADPSGAATSTLLWTDAGDLPAGAHFDVRFSAKPLVAAAAHANPQTNTTHSAGDDASGADGNANGPYDTDDATADATLLVPDVSIVKTPDGEHVDADSTATFHVAVTETTGDAPLRDVQVVDVLPAGTTYTAQAASAAPFPLTGETIQADTPAAGQTTITWTIAQIDAGESTTIDVPVHVANGLADGTTLTNDASVTTREVTTPKSDEGSVVVDSATELAAEKSATPPSGSTVQPGSSIDYAIAYGNTGNEDATGVTLTDEVRLHTTYVLGSATSSPAATVEYQVGGVFQSTEPASGADVQALRWTVGDVPADGPGGTVGFTSKIDNPLVDGTHILNVGILDSDQTGPTPTNTTDHVVESAPDLKLVKTVDHTVLDTPVDGTTLNYGLTLTNTGNEDATDVTITDAPPAGTKVSSIPAPPTGVTVECDTGSGFAACPTTQLGDVQQLRWSTATVTTTVPLTVSFLVDVTLPAANDTVIPNTGAYDSNETPEGASNEVQTRLLTSGILTIEKTGPASALAGSVVPYDVTTTNTGPATATGVTISDPLPAGTTFVADQSSANCAEASGTVTCPVGTLAAGASAKATIALQTTDEQAGTTVTNTASVTSKERPDPVTSAAATVLTGASALTLEKELLTDTPLADRSMTYRVTVTSTGTLAAKGVQVVDTMTGNVKVKSATPGQGTCAIAGKTITCQLGTLAPAQVVTITVVATPQDAGTVKNTAVATGLGIATPSQDTVSAKVKLPKATATLRKRLVSPRSGIVAIGKTVRYELTYRVTSAAAARDVKICDTLPRQLKLVTAKGAKVKGKRVCWTHELVKGKRSVKHTVVARVTAGAAAGSIRNVATSGAANARSGRAGATVKVPKQAPGFTG